MKIFLKSISLILLISTLPLFGQDGFSSFMTYEDIPALQWSGEGSLNTRYYSDYSNILESNIDVYPKINLDLDYIGERSEFHGKIGFSGYSNLQNQSDVSTFVDQIIEEAYFRLFFNKFDIEAGYMKIIWGKGDEVFTFDNLNATDYSDFINPSYMDRKISEAMIKLNVPFGMQGMVEAVYTPVFTPDINPTDGVWVQSDYEALEDTSTIAHSQLGFRITNSIRGFDLGTSYQFTFLREPVVDLSITDSLPVSWERIHLFGLETAFVILGFNIRSEAAYYMTSDFAGDDPLVYNNRLLYLFGFDRDLLVHNLSINIQGRGEIKTGSDNISLSDIEYDPTGVYKSHLIEGGLRDSFLNERIIAELNGAYSIEDEDFMIMPEFRINLVEDTWVNMKYTFYYGDSNTLFGQFEDNDFLEIRMEYSF